MSETSAVIPIVNYLDLDAPGGPQLIATMCSECAASYFGRRIACSRCGSRSFERRPVSREGLLRSFTIVHRAAPGIATPYVSALVELGEGAAVKTNVVNCPADPEHVRLGMRVRMHVYPVGKDDAGTTAMAFGFEPAEEGGTPA